MKRKTLFTLWVWCAFFLLACMLPLYWLGWLPLFAVLLLCLGIVGEMELFRNRGPGFGRKIAGRGGKLLEISGWEPRFSPGFVSHCGRNHDWRNH